MKYKINGTKKMPALPGRSLTFTRKIMLYFNYFGIPIRVCSKLMKKRELKGLSMKMQKRQFRIGELAHYLNVEKFVIRFWEKEFDMRTSRSTGGQRFYDEKDIEKFTAIKELLYQKGFTIAGAKQQLKERTKRKASMASDEESRIVPSQRITAAVEKILDGEPTREQLEQQIVDLQKQLMKLRELL